MRVLVFVAAALFFAVPCGALVVTEVLADPSGADEGREWVELYGDALPPGARFFEDGGSHAVRLVAGECSSGCVMLIADDAGRLLEDYTIEEGVLVYDSSWGSLRNSGEEVGVVGSASVVYKEVPEGMSWAPLSGTSGVPTPGTYISAGGVEVPEFSCFYSLLVLAIIFVIFLYRR